MDILVQQIITFYQFLAWYFLCFLFYQSSIKVKDPIQNKSIPNWVIYHFDCQRAFWLIQELQISPLLSFMLNEQLIQQLKFKTRINIKTWSFETKKFNGHPKLYFEHLKNPPRNPKLGKKNLVKLGSFSAVVWKFFPSSNGQVDNEVCYYILELDVGAIKI